MIKAGTDINLTGSRTPLTRACYRGHINIVRELINLGADVNQSDGNKTPLTTACDKGYYSVVQELIEARANVNQTYGNKTPITAARKNFSFFVINLLTRAGLMSIKAMEN